MYGCFKQEALSIVNPGWFLMKQFAVSEQIALKIMTSSIDELRMLSRYSIADELELTPNYISYRFKTDTNMTVLRFIDREKMIRAKSLLESHQKHPIKTISRMVGIAKPQHFSNKFQRIFGVTPGKYRKIYKQRMQMPA